MVTSGIANMFRIPELRKRLLFTLGILGVYRLGIFVTTPGVDRVAMRRVVQSSGGLLGLFNLFSGGALEQLSIFALGIMPYISASIILQLLTVVIPALEKMQKEGEVGRRKITQYTRYGTIVLSVIQGYGIASYLESLRDQSTGRGVGNGISLIIFAGIVARIPDAIYQTYAAYRTPGAGLDEFKVILLAAVMIFVVALIV